MKITASQLRRIIKEEVAAALPVVDSKDPQRFLHGFESGHPMDDEGYMIKSRMADVKEMAETICDLLDEGDQLPAWVQDLVASAHTDLEHVKDYLAGDEKLRAYKGTEHQHESYDVKPGQAVSDEEIMDKYGHMMGELSTRAGQDRLYDRLVKDTMSYDYADAVFDRMQTLATQRGSVTESASYRRGLMLEGHNRITPEEMNAWLQGDWGYVAEHDGGRRRGHAGGLYGGHPAMGGSGRMDDPPTDPAALRDYIITHYSGIMPDLGVDDAGDPAFKQYVKDNLAGVVDRKTLDAALSLI